MIVVVNARTYRGDGIYVGRFHPRFSGGSPLGNPFVIGKDGMRRQVVEKYRRWLRQEWCAGGVVKDELLRLVELYRREGRLMLICWCAPELCHADVIADAIVKVAAALQPGISVDIQAE